MFKKNILPIFLLALVVVLSVFYIKQAPADSSVVGGDTNFETETVSSDFANKRLDVLTARSDEIDELECMVASGEYNDKEIASIIDKINQLYYIIIQKYRKGNMAMLDYSLYPNGLLKYAKNRNISFNFKNDDLIIITNI